MVMAAALARLFSQSTSETAAKATMLDSLMTPTRVRRPKSKADDFE
jgi:hypothetical protein